MSAFIIRWMLRRTRQPSTSPWGPPFRTKLDLAVELVRRATQVPVAFRAVVADSFYGEDRGVRRGLGELDVGYVLALKPSHSWWHPEAAIGSLHEAAAAAPWRSAK